jgi:hypothetical protein
MNLRVLVHAGVRSKYLSAKYIDQNSTSLTSAEFIYDYILFNK